MAQVLQKVSPDHFDSAIRFFTKQHHRWLKTACSVYSRRLPHFLATVSNCFVFIFGTETIVCYHYPTNGKSRSWRESVHDETSWGGKWLHACWSNRCLLCNRAHYTRGCDFSVSLFARDTKNGGQEVQYGEVLLYMNKHGIALNKLCSICHPSWRPKGSRGFPKMYLRLNSHGRSPLPSSEMALGLRTCCPKLVNLVRMLSLKRNYTCESQMALKLAIL